MQKALLCGVLIAVASALLGIFLVLRKQSMISDGLSHVSFATVALALFLGLSPLIISIPLVILASMLINKLTEKSHMYSDAAIGLVSAFSIAVGVIIISMSKGFNIDIYSYLFGSILAITNLEVILSIVISFIVIVVLIFFFNEFFLLTYDSDYAHISKINIKTINIIFSIIQSITIVISVKIVDAMLMYSLIIFTVINALQDANIFKKI
ncbi:MAG TPA: metal ABC transporter permease, partial [Spirochaetota bacterium]|nr:metal ABC transporter permease [Spirochaetota bacterium]